MKLAHRQLLIASLALLFGGAALANDPPKADAKKEEKKDDKSKDGKDAKAEAPADPDLPSKPYPTSAAPKAFAPKGEPKKEVAAAEKPADKPADKPAAKAADKGADKPVAKVADKPADKAADKHADKHGDKHADKPADDKLADKHEPGHNKPAMKKKTAKAAPVKPVTDPVMAQVARESLQGNAAAGGYKVRQGDNLDRVIRKTMPNSPFSLEVMREAFGRANPQLLANLKDVKLKPGSMLNLPNAAVMRSVVLGDPAPQAEPMRVKAVGDLYAKAPVVNPTIAPSANEPNSTIAIPRQAVSVASSLNPAPEVSPEEKKKWVRFP
jgi:hypothetical protein